MRGTSFVAVVCDSRYATLLCGGCNKWNENVKDIFACVKLASGTC